MKRPLAYVTAAWRGGECEVMEQAAKYCRIVYDAGYSPICPMLYLPLFLNDAVPEVFYSYNRLYKYAKNVQKCKCSKNLLRNSSFSCNP